MFKKLLKREFKKALTVQQIMGLGLLLIMEKMIIDFIVYVR